MTKKLSTLKIGQKSNYLDIKDNTQRIKLAGIEIDAHKILTKKNNEIISLLDNFNTEIKKYSHQKTPNIVFTDRISELSEHIDNINTQHYEVIVKDKEAWLNYPTKDGYLRGVEYGYGKSGRRVIKRHLKLKQVQNESAIKSIKNIGSQVALAAIVIQLQEISAKIDNISRDMQKDRYASIYSGILSIAEACEMENTENRNHLLLNAQQSIQEGISKLLLHLPSDLDNCEMPNDKLFCLQYLFSGKSSTEEKMNNILETILWIIDGMKANYLIYSLLSPAESRAAIKALNSVYNELSKIDYYKSHEKCRRLYSANADKSKYNFFNILSDAVDCIKNTIIDIDSITNSDKQLVMKGTL